MTCMLSWAWFCAIYLDLSCAASIIFKIPNSVCECNASLTYVPIKICYYFIIMYSMSKKNMGIHYCLHISISDD